MFATLKYHPQSSISEVGKSIPRRSSVSISRLACVHCRQKKLRCSGGDPACERCTLKGLECTYPKRATRAKTKKSATAQSKSSAERSDASKSPEPVAHPPEQQDSRNQSSESSKDPNLDVMDTTTSRLGSVEPDKSFPAHEDLQIFGTTPPMDTSLDYEMQLSTPVRSSITLTGENRPHTIGIEKASAEPVPNFNNLVSDTCDLNDYISPLASVPWCDDWLDPAWSREPAALQGLESADAKSKTNKAQTSLLFKCNCVQLAIKAHEEATAWTDTDDLLLAHSALAAHKEYLTQCESWLSCTTCSSPSSVIILVLVVTDKLINSFRRIYAFSQSLVGAVTSLNAAETSGCERLVDGVKEADRCIYLGNYQIESSGEWSRVMNVLLSSQLSRLSRLYMKVWARLNSLKEESQVQIIQQQEERLRTFIGHFERSAPFSVS